jgi:hypothetical protein
LCLLQCIKIMLYFVQSNTTYVSGGNMFRLINKSPSGHCYAYSCTIDQLSYRMAWRWLVNKSKHFATWNIRCVRLYKVQHYFNILESIILISFPRQ